MSSIVAMQGQQGSLSALATLLGSAAQSAGAGAAPATHEAPSGAVAAGQRQQQLRQQLAALQRSHRTGEAYGGTTDGATPSHGRGQIGGDGGAAGASSAGLAALTAAGISPSVLSALTMLAGKTYGGGALASTASQGTVAGLVQRAMSAADAFGDSGQLAPPELASAPRAFERAWAGYAPEAPRLGRDDYAAPKNALSALEFISPGSAEAGFGSGHGRGRGGFVAPGADAFGGGLGRPLPRGEGAPYGGAAERARQQAEAWRVRDAEGGRAAAYETATSLAGGPGSDGRGSPRAEASAAVVVPPTRLAPINTVSTSTAGLKLRVVCNEVDGIVNLDQQVVACHCAACDERVEQGHERPLFSFTRFERHAGSKAKKWRLSLRLVQGSVPECQIGDPPLPLGFWLDARGISSGSPHGRGPGAAAPAPRRSSGVRGGRGGAGSTAPKRRSRGRFGWDEDEDEEDEEETEGDDAGGEGDATGDEGDGADDEGGHGGDDVVPRRPLSARLREASRRASPPRGVDASPTLVRAPHVDSLSPKRPRLSTGPGAAGSPAASFGPSPGSTPPSARWLRTLQGELDDLERGVLVGGGGRAPVPSAILAAKRSAILEANYGLLDPPSRLRFGFFYVPWLNENGSERLEAEFQTLRSHLAMLDKGWPADEVLALLRAAVQGQLSRIERGAGSPTAPRAARSQPPPAAADSEKAAGRVALAAPATAAAAEHLAGSHERERLPDPVEARELGLADVPPRLERSPPTLRARLPCRVPSRIERL